MKILRISSILQRYVLRKILLNFVYLFILIALIILGNQFMLVLKESVEQGYYNIDILELTFLKFTRDLTLLISISLFSSIILSLNSFYKSSEALIMNSAGLSNKNFIKILFVPLFSLSILIIALIYLIEPKAITKIDEIRNKNLNSPEYTYLLKDQFQIFNNGKIVFYSANIKDMPNNDQSFGRVFLNINSESKSYIFSDSGRKITHKDGTTYIILNSGKKYSFDVLTNELMSISSFEKLSILIYDPSNFETSFNKKIKTLYEKNADLFWKISKFIFFVLSSIAAVFFINKNNRKKKSFVIFYGISFFLVYYNFLLSVRTLIEENTISLVNAFLITHFIFFIFILVLYKIKNNSIDG